MRNMGTKQRRNFRTRVTPRGSTDKHTSMDDHKERTVETKGSVLGRVSRWSFLSQLGAAGVIATARPLAGAQAATAVETQETAEPAVVGAIAVSLRVNGKAMTLQLDRGQRCSIACARTCSSRARRSAAITGSAARALCM